MTNKELVAKVEALELRIANLEKINSGLIANIRATSRTNAVDSKESKPAKTPVVVGNLIFDGKFVKTGTGYMSSKTRFAIMKTITEEFNGVKLAKGNPTFDKCHKADKYVQVYEFKTKADCDKFRKAQEKRVG